MTIECDMTTGRLSPGGAQNVIGLNVGAEICQVSVLFSGSSQDVRESYIILDYSGGGNTEFPTPHQLKRIHGGTSDGSKINLSIYNSASDVYGYYANTGEEINNQVDILLENGDSRNYTNYECVALYHS